MRVRIVSEKTLKNSIYFGGCRTRRQRFWWVYCHDHKRWVDLGNRYMPGNKPIDITIDLDAGRYELGTGPHQGGIRKPFEVLEATTHAVQTVRVLK